MAGLRTVVTGASTGIGAAIARAFAGAGAEVLLTHRDSEQEASRVAGAIERAGGAAHVVRADVSTAGGCAALVEQATTTLGARIDAWVNNAGADVLTGAGASWSAEEKLDALLDVDLRGTIRCSRAVGALMCRQPRGGAIVNVGWDQATTGMAGENPELFSAVKAGVLGYSKSLARSLAPSVRVNVVCPGWIETRFGAEVADRAFYDEIAASTPLRRWGRPADVAQAALWLASPQATFVTGQAVNVNGGVVG